MAGNFIGGPETKFTRAIVEALGIDPDKHPVTKVTLEASCYKAASATVTFLIREEQDELISQVIRKHEFKEEPTEKIETWSAEPFVGEPKTWRDKDPQL